MAAHSLLVSEDGVWSLYLRLPKSWNPGRMLPTDTPSLPAPQPGKGCLGFQNMLFVQPQRGTAPCRLVAAGLAELVLDVQEREEKHERAAEGGSQLGASELVCCWNEGIEYFPTRSANQPGFLGPFLTSVSRYHLLERRLKRKLGKVSQCDRDGAALTPSCLHL